MSNREAIALLRNLEDALDSYCELNEEGKTAFRMAITALELFGNSEQLPCAQPKTGKWVYGSPVTVKCNQCGFYIPDWEAHSSRFCPNCGCRMKEGE